MTSMIRLYLAGPMTGLPDFNRPAFDAVAKRLRAVGYHVENPAENAGPAADDYAGWIRAGLSQLLACNTVILLDGWQASRGALLEVQVAGALGLEVATVYEWTGEVQAHFVKAAG